MRISDWSSDVCSSDLAGDGARALASGELAEDALDDQRLGRIDLALATHKLTLAREAADLTIAVADRTGRIALLDPATQAAMRLLGQIFQEQRVHRALEPEMELGDFTFGQGEERKRAG